MREQRSARAPAKVNLILEVTGRREDGYHAVDTILQTLELADRVTVTFGASSGVTVTGQFAYGTPASETNLAWRAATELARVCGRDVTPVGIALEKCVPPAGGLGGGASDAATVLRLLQREWKATDAQLIEAANAVGSDEVFFLTGGTCRARGRGDRVEALASLPVHGVVLFVPPQSIERKTARMFQALGELPFDSGRVAEGFAAGPPPQFSGTAVYNSFERVAFDLFPGLTALWESIERRITEPVHLAGAGPTLFWIGPLPSAAAIAERAAGLACTVIPTRTADSPWQP
jgi:4-diphosphocytidyl-2-C-methyl-D-erythritol kinase